MSTDAGGLRKRSRGMRCSPGADDSFGGGFADLHGTNLTVSSKPNAQTRNIPPRVPRSVITYSPTAVRWEWGSTAEWAVGRSSRPSTRFLLKSTPAHCSMKWATSVIMPLLKRRRKSLQGVFLL